MKAAWRIFIESAKETKAVKVFARFCGELGVSIDGLVLEPYHKGGYVASFETQLESDQWNDCVVEIIALGQRVAYQWLITGSVHDSLDGWSSDSRVSGITNVWWGVVKTTSSCNTQRTESK
jgi:hypothetical protein